MEYLLELIAPKEYFEIVRRPKRFLGQFMDAGGGGFTGGGSGPPVHGVGRQHSVAHRR